MATRSSKEGRKRIAKKPLTTRKARGVPKGLATASAATVWTDGIDVSQHQGPVDWTKVGASKSFAYIKATEGTTLVDTRFATNWAGARNQLLRGAYHYFTWKSDPDTQADNFLKTLGKLEVSDLPPLLDLEETAGIKELTVQQRTARVTRWLERMKSDLKRIPVLYLQKSFMVGYFQDGDFFKNYPLFAIDIAQSPPRLPSAWPDWTLWQHSFTGTVSGITGSVDLDRFNGDLVAMRLFIGKTTLP